MMMIIRFTSLMCSLRWNLVDEEIIDDFQVEKIDSNERLEIEVYACR